MQLMFGKIRFKTFGNFAGKPLRETPEGTFGDFLGSPEGISREPL